MMPTLSPAAPLPAEPFPEPTPEAAAPVTVTAARSAWRTILLLYAYSALLALGMFALTGRYGLNFADEGFLRYGVRAIVTAGQVPLRDFQSYDPGRYYWAAGWSLLLGDGIVTTRLACSLFQALSVGTALVALRRAGVGRWTLLLTGLLASLWMLENFKLYEQCIALMALYPAVRLVQQPDRRNAFIAGVFVGLAAFMGRNHGFYNAVAFGGLLLFLAWKRREPATLKLLAPWVGGIFLGYLPMLLMLAFVPGFFTALVDTLSILVRAKTTNLTLPVPWPWTRYPSQEPIPMFHVHMVATGWCFVSLLVGFAAAAVAILRLSGKNLREHAALVAAGIIGIPYAHYAFSRADSPHLAHSMPLLIVTVLLLPTTLRSPVARRRTAAGAAVGLCVLTFFATFVYHRTTVRAALGSNQQAEVTIGEQTLDMPRGRAAFLETLQRFSQEVMAPDENILFAPHLPSLYEVAGRLSPTDEIYFLWPQDDAGWRKLQAALESKRVNWALLQLINLDGDPQRSLQSTHPQLSQYLKENFTRMNDLGLPYPYVLLHRTVPLPAGTK